MSELLLINPRAKRRSRRRRPMTALQRQYFGGGRKATRLARNPRRRVRRMRRNPVATSALSGAPSRRRFSRARAYVRRVRSRSGGNPFSISGITDMLVPAMIGAGGALALDMAWGSLPIPDALKTGTFAPVTRIAGALGIGVLVGMVAGKRYGAIAGAGALTVTVYDLVKPIVAANLPSVPLGYYSPARQMGVYNGMGVYR